MTAADGHATSSQGAWDLWRTLPRAFPYARPYRRLNVTAYGLTLSSAVVALAQPWPLAIVVDNVLGDRGTTGLLRAVFGEDPSAYALLAFAVLAGFLLTFLTHSVDVLTDWVTAKLEQRMVLDLRTEMFDHAQGLSLTFHDGRMTGQLMNQINMQAAALGAIVVAFPPIVQAALTLVGMFVITALIAWQVAVVALVAVPFIWWSLGLYGTKIVPRLKRVQALEWQSLSIVHEAMAMLRVIVAFGREKHESSRFRSQGEVAVDERVKLTVRQTLFSLAVTSATAVGTGLVLGVGALLAMDGQISVGELLVLIAYVAGIYQPLEQISNTIGTMNDHFVQFNSSLDLLDEEQEVREAPDAIDIGRARGDVAFDAVGFAYKGRKDTLSDISFRAQPGQRVAIVGPTGAGKSTLISLLIRYYDPHEGRVLIDGVDLRRLTLECLRRQISVVLQEPLLFSGTIADNIAYGKLEASREEIERAARAANAHDFIERLPDGYDTQLGERGAQLSGGERQRISVARAFIKDAPILVLDEPTSSIDSKTEDVILDALEDLMAGRTSFMIAHRLSTVRDADLILVLQDGRIVEQGSHDELLEGDGVYAQLHGAQTRTRRRRAARGAVALVEPPPAPGPDATAERAAAEGDFDAPPAASPPEPGDFDRLATDRGGAHGGAAGAVDVDAEPDPEPPLALANRPERGAWRPVAAVAIGVLAAGGLVAWAVLDGSGDARREPPAGAAPLRARAVVVGGLPTGVAVARGSVYVSRSRETRLAVIDAERFDGARPGPPVPLRSTDIDAGHDALWVTSAAPGALTRIDLTTQSRTRTRLPGAFPAIVRTAGKEVLVAVRTAPSASAPAQLIAADPRSGRVGRAWSVPEGIADLDVRGNVVWIANATSPTVTRIALSDGTTSRVPAGDAASTGIAVGSAVWVTEARRGRVLRLGPAGVRASGVIPGAPRGAALAGGRLWVAALEGDRLVEVDGAARPTGRAVRVPAPAKIVVDAGALFVTSTRTGRVHRVQLGRR